MPNGIRSDRTGNRIVPNEKCLFNVEGWVERDAKHVLNVHESAQVDLDAILRIERTWELFGIKFQIHELQIVLPLNMDIEYYFIDRAV